MISMRLEAQAPHRRLWAVRDGGVAPAPAAAATAVRTTRLTGIRAALRDPLTGALNRRGLVTALARLPEPPAGQQVTVALVELDGFRQIGHRFGQVAADGVLRSVTERLNTLRAAGCLVARLGGDELVVIATLPHHAAGAFAEGIRAAVYDPSDTYLVTAGVGVSRTTSVPMRNAADVWLEEMLFQAHEARCRAKRLQLAETLRNQQVGFPLAPVRTAG